MLNVAPRRQDFTASAKCKEINSIVLYCILFKTSMRRIHNIVNIQHTDNNEYITFKELNTIIKIKIKSIINKQL
jgi:hypothetical protein